MSIDALALPASEWWWLQLAAIVLATFVSEDFTCLAVGLLVRAGEVSLGVGLVGCFAGIFLGDAGLWLIGRLIGVGLFSTRWVDVARMEAMAAWFARHGWLAVLASRFLPGTRLPLYVAAGVMGRDGGRFLLWVAIAGVLWVPLLVGAAVLLGDAVSPLAHVFGSGWLSLVLLVAALFVVVRLGTLSATPAGRGRILANLARLWQWEFWPAWLFYLPLLPWLAWLSLRYRSVLVWTAANPGIPDGGVVGESKSAILAQLPQAWIVPTLAIAPGPIEDRIGRLADALRAWSFPVILKPDAAQRGAAVKKAADLDEVRTYLLANPDAVIAQPYHPGPFEAGIFYVRLPGEPTGRIFSLTDKVFPLLTGDGRSTIEELIWRHPRYRMQADTFLRRHAARRDHVLREGETLPLALAGNHCQGTLFRDGTHLITPELERTVDAIASAFPGFYFGRFDVRYTDPEAFRAGDELAIVELNGVTSESTNLYDPGWSLLDAYRVLFRQWALLYQIGDANRRRGQAVPTLTGLLGRIREYYRHRRIEALAD